MEDAKLMTRNYVINQSGHIRYLVRIDDMEIDEIVSTVGWCPLSFGAVLCNNIFLCFLSSKGPLAI